MIRGVFILTLGAGLGYFAALEHHQNIGEKLQTLTEALDRDVRARRAEAAANTTKGETP